jgi:hypothetical protein
MTSRAKFVPKSKAARLREFFTAYPNELFGGSLQDAVSFASKEGKIKGVKVADVSGVRQSLRGTRAKDVVGGDFSFSKEEVLAVKRFADKNGGLAKLKSVLDFIEAVSK